MNLAAGSANRSRRIAAAAVVEGVCPRCESARQEIPPVGTAQPPRLAVIIPAHNAAGTIGRCLGALIPSLPDGVEVIVVDDGSNDGTLDIASRFECTLVRLRTNGGASHARNAGAALTRAPLLLFLDADIVVEPTTVELVLESMNSHPEWAGLFGSYGEDTPHQNICSQYKNLIHHYTHQTSSEFPGTFCGGFGAIRRDVFLAQRGFDCAQRSLEDIELGYRLLQAGHQVRLLKQLQMTHLKRYGFRSLIESDLHQRATPWTELMLRYRLFRLDLNTRSHHVLSVITSVAMLALLPLVWFSSSWLAVVAGLAVLFAWLNRGFLGFVLNARSVAIAAQVGVLSWLVYVVSALGLLLGTRNWLRNTIRIPR